MYRETAKKGKFSITTGCIKKIPLNPPLQKGEAVGMRGLIEMLLYFVCNGSVNGKDKTYVQFK